ncbi:hypothetical protein OsJ_04157 [Oryza sativa Japonica Group]|uniref:Uncharacterized protein n=1 Tax=Oryza sativa subsp. japonica TaxID=39947 RepID=A2ZZT6_ORYSJ|nr:hypothetical protein OsJ_04157 [Oryza sativa Japonica Group]
MAASLRASSSSLRSRLLSSSSAAWSPWSHVLSSSVHSEASNQTETLAFDEIQLSPEKPSTATAFVLHGLLGSGRNWRSFSRALASELRDRSPSDEWRMVLVDLRNHGRSAGIKGLRPPHDMSTAARDLADLVKARGWAWPDVVVGHSMGGKVALDFAESCSRGDYGESADLPKQLGQTPLEGWFPDNYDRMLCQEILWVLDSVPGQVETDNSDGEVERVLQTLASLPSSLPSRKWVVDHMINLGFSKSLSEWIGSNLKKDNEHVTWAFDLQAAIDMFNSYRERSYWTLLENPPKGLDIAIVQAELSDRWLSDDVQRLKALSRRESKPDAGKVSLHVLPNSGHWVHVDNPKGLLEIMVPNFLSTVDSMYSMSCGNHVVFERKCLAPVECCASVRQCKYATRARTFQNSTNEQRQAPTFCSSMDPATVGGGGGEPEAAAEWRARAVGGMEYGWYRAVPGGTGTTLLALRLARGAEAAVAAATVQAALRAILDAHPVLRARLRGHELNRNPWTAAAATATASEHEPDAPPVLFATLYELPPPAGGGSALFVRIHTAACDRAASASLVRELLAQLAGDGAAAAAASEPEDAAVRASLEERIPQRDSWKPFWARGLDMVGYSINGLRTSTLPFEVTGTERSTQMLRLGFDRDETTRLLDACKQNGVKLCAAMAAATLLAARQSKLQLASNQQETYSIATLINCRKFLEPALDDHNVGFYHSAITNTHAIHGGEELWELAKRCQDSYTNAKNNKKHLTDIADLNFLMCRAIENPQLTTGSALRTACPEIE